MPQDPIYFGEETDIGCTWKPAKSDWVVTITEATVTIKDAAGVATRTGEDCTVDDMDVFYHEEFSTANGYAEDGLYTATFKTTLSSGENTYVEKWETRFRLLSAGDDDGES